MELQSSLEQKGKENTWLLKASESLGPQNLAPHVGYLRVHHEFLTCGCLIWPFFFGAVDLRFVLKKELANTLKSVVHLAEWHGTTVVVKSVKMEQRWPFWGPGTWFGFPGELGFTSRWFAEDCLD